MPSLRKRPLVLAAVAFLTAGALPVTQDRGTWIGAQARFLPETHQVEVLARFRGYRSCGEAQPGHLVVRLYRDQPSTAGGNQYLGYSWTCAETAPVNERTVHLSIPQSWVRERAVGYLETWYQPAGGTAPQLAGEAVGPIEITGAPVTTALHTGFGSGGRIAYSGSGADARVVLEGAEPLAYAMLFVSSSPILGDPAKSIPLAGGDSFALSRPIAIPASFGFTDADGRLEVALAGVPAVEDTRLFFQWLILPPGASGDAMSEYRATDVLEADPASAGS